MKSKSKSSVARAFGIGLVAGLRSMTAPAAVIRAARRNPRALRRSNLSFLSSPPAATVMSVLAVGELVADKLPIIPSRLSPPSLVTRLVSGALSGAAVSAVARNSAAKGALVGAAGAITAAFAGYHLRRLAGSQLHLPDVAIAPVEDLLAVGGAKFITQAW